MAILMRFAPWIVLGLVIVAVYSAGSFLVRDWKASITKDAYQAGETAERSRQEQIARRIEENLGAKIDALDQRTGEQLSQQAQTEIVYVDRIRTEIKNNPVYSQCLVDNGVLADRNGIRKSLESAISPAAGTGSE